MPYADVPAFVASLKAEDNMSARALEFCILTAARTGEVIGARREESDLEAKVWTCQPGA
jgi:integrase